MSDPADRPTVLTGATVVLPDRVASGVAIVIRDGRVDDLPAGPFPVTSEATAVDLSGCTVVPGFIDGHIHGLSAVDVLDGDDAVSQVAAALPRHGVTAFAPTTTACPPAALGRFLDAVARARQSDTIGSARVLPAHLESNFINPEYRGAQPRAWLCSIEPLTARGEDAPRCSGRDVLEVIDAHRADVGIVTLAPELEGALALIRSLVAGGVQVSIGHSGATSRQAEAAIEAGARRATHLFNRMRPMTHRDPGIAGAVLASDEVAAELICDGCHVDATMVRVALAAKGTSRIMVVSDATAGAGLPPGTRTMLGGQPIVVSDAARLEDGTLAGSVVTMDRAFAFLVAECGLDLVQAATVCATTPARQFGLHGRGVIASGADADLAVLDSRLAVVQTWIGGRRVV